jgi:hypothetical protein
MGFKINRASSIRAIAVIVAPWVLRFVSNPLFWNGTNEFLPALFIIVGHY